MSLFGELRRRSVFKVAVAYAVLAWLLIQVAAVFLPTFEAPDWVLQTVTFLAVLGFPLAVGLAWAFDVTPGGIKRTAAADRHAIDRAPTNDAHTADVGPAAPSELVRPLENSIAVLPFANISPNPDDAYFAVGIHEEILNQLAKLSALNVVARTSVLPYAAHDKSIPQIAKELNVEAIMEGSVRYAGNRVRVTTQLIAADSGMHLWSETYDRKFEDIFEIESDIAFQVANALKATFSLEEQQQIEQRPTQSAEAYAVYLQAISVAAQTTDAAPLHALYDRALELDPDFAPAYAEKAALYADALVNTVEGTAVTPEERDEIQQLARSYADKALALDPNCGEAHAASASVSFFTWRWSDASKSFDKFSRWDKGGFLFSIGRQAWLLAYSGRADEAVELCVDRLESTRRDDWVSKLLLGTTYGYARRYERAIEHLQAGARVAPAVPIMHLWTAILLSARGQAQRALAEARSVERLLGTHRIPVYLPELAMTYARLGQHDDVERLGAEIRALAESIDLGDGTWAMLYLAEGNEPRAPEHLERLAQKAEKHEIDQGFFQAMNLKMNIWADPRLEDARMRKVFSRITGT